MMSNDNIMGGMSHRSRLKAEVTYLMLKGAGYAAIFVLAIWFVLAVIAWFGSNVLPADAQMADDPAPAAFADMPDQ
jgi:hypothetical protein